MTDTNDAASAAAQGTVAPSIQAQAAQPAAEKTKGDKKKIELSPKKLKARLEQERDKGEKRARAKLMGELGLSEDVDIKAKLDRLKELDELGLTRKQKLAKEVEELRPQAEIAEARGVLLQSVLDENLSALPKKVREAIEEDCETPEDRAFALRFMRKTGMLDALSATKAASETEAAASKEPPPIAAPASTAAASGAPVPPLPAMTDHKSRWQELKKENPLAAATYLLRHAKEIFPSAMQR